MTHLQKEYDCVVLGGGMFGLYTTMYLSSRGAHVAVLEKDKTLFNRASRYNQSRIHRGYHYPRSFETAQKVANYYQRFCADYYFSLLSDFKQYYSIAKEDSKISANDYAKFCNKINIPLVEIDSKNFFKDDLVEATFKVEEACFDYEKIKNYFLKKFVNNKYVDIYYQSFPTAYNVLSSKYCLKLNNSSTKVVTPVIINSTYNNVNEVNKLFGFPGYEIKYELCELMLCQTNEKLFHTGITVMDGPFFSVMPFGDGHVSSLWSVDLSPVSVSYSKPQSNRRLIFNLLNNIIIRNSNWTRMNSTARSFLNDNINDLSYIKSVFEIKPILTSSEIDDSRPTLITTHSKTPTFISILAGKISTIYDLDATLNEILYNRK